MQKKGKNNQGYDDHLFDEGSLKCPNGIANQNRAVIGGNNFNTRRQPRFDFFNALFYPVDDVQSIFAVTHDDNAPHGDAFTVQFCLTPLHGRPELYVA